MKMRRTVCFDDVLLEPAFSEINSRQEINLTSPLDEPKGFFLRVPIVSSPMDTVTGSEMIAEMYKFGGLGILHRYNSIKEQIALVKEIDELAEKNDLQGKLLYGAAIGITDDYFKRAVALVSAGCKILCLDVAHGHHALMKAALKQLKHRFGEKVHLMAGNIATLEAFNDLSDWGADSIRVGVGGGSICSTRIQTGHGIPTLQSIIDCAATDRDAILIADGGIKNSGDMVKALAAGADLVMCGSLLAGTKETPGAVLRAPGDDKVPRKIYRGMASREAQKSWRGKVGSVEGVSTTVPIRGIVADVLHDLEWGIRSGLSYSGARNLYELRTQSKFIEQSQSSQSESLPHALARL